MMLFIHTLDKVLSGEKTQTRRIVKPGDTTLNYWRNPVKDNRYYEGSIDPIGVVRRGGRDLWMVTRDYAVQPGRTKPAVRRILIKSIRREDVRNISDEDVKAEGFTDKFEFMRVWISMHDREIHKQQYWGLESIKERPAEFYQAWVIEFVLVPNWLAESSE